MRFIGNIEAKIDSKGRVFLPAGFRRTLQTAGCEKIMMRKDPHQPCLSLYPESVWNALLDQLRNKLDRWSSHGQMLFRMFVANVEELSIDGSGRLLLPKRYRDLAGIEQEVLFIGMDDTIEVWAKEKAEEPFMSPDEFARELERIMATDNNHTKEETERREQ